MAEHCFEFPSELTAEIRLHRELMRLLDQYDIDGDTVRILLLVMSEAFCNAVVHGNRLDPSLKVKVRVSINDDSLIADIEDQGFGASAVRGGRREAGLYDEGGRGIRLMEYFASSVDFDKTESGGTIVRLRLDRSQHEADEIEFEK